MIDLHYWPTPNGWKATIMREECGLPYRVFPVNILAGEQFNPDFLKIASNNRIPAIVDQAPVNGGPAVNIFESGAILIYLAEKTGKFLPKDGMARYAVTQWLRWQMGGVGPMSGQANYFCNRAKDHIEHAITRYTNEVNRLYGVLDRHLEDREFTAGAYSIADIAIYPWMIGHADLGQTLDDFSNLKRWFNTVRVRPAVMRGYAVMEKTRRNQKPLDDQTRAFYFGQTAATVRA